eukprot:333067-Prymnesium_polylepis.1
MGVGGGTSALLTAVVVTVISLKLWLTVINRVRHVTLLDTTKSPHDHGHTRFDPVHPPERARACE